MRYTIKMAVAARQSLYRIPRGLVADVTTTISSLATAPTPYQALPSGLPTIYLLAVADHVIAYEVVEAEHTIVILWIGE